MTHVFKSARIQRKFLERQKNILDVAMYLLTQGGLDAVTVQSIAKELDLTVGALYRYYPSKSAILAALTQRSLEELHGELQKAAQQANTPVAALLHVARAHISFASAQRGHGLLIAQMMTTPQVVLPPAERELAMQPAFSLIDFLEEQFVSAQTAGLIQVSDTRAAALIFWSAIQGVMQLDKLGSMNPNELHRPNLPLRTAISLLKAWGAHVDDSLR